MYIVGKVSPDVKKLKEKDGRSYKLRRFTEGGIIAPGKLNHNTGSV
jgi:hypothetical protein